MIYMWKNKARWRGKSQEESCLLGGSGLVQNVMREDYDENSFGDIP